jgi:hypothetical protein
MLVKVWDTYIEVLPEVQSMEDYMMQNMDLDYTEEDEDNKVQSETCQIWDGQDLILVIGPDFDTIKKAYEEDFLIKDMGMTKEQAAEQMKHHDMWER